MFCMYVNYGTHCTHDNPWKEGFPTLRPCSRFIPCCYGSSIALWWARVYILYIWPFKPFETVPVTNGAIQIQLNYTIDLMKSSL